MVRGGGTLEGRGCQGASRGWRPRSVLSSLALGLLLIACSLAWAGLDLVRKGLAHHGTPTALALLVNAAQLPLLFLWLWPQGAWWPTGGYWLPFAGSLLLNLVANVAFMRSVALSAVSATVPLLALTPAFSTLFAMPLLGEHPTSLQLLGVATVVCGALLMSSEAPVQEGRGTAAGQPRWWQRLFREPGAPWMVLVALCWSLTPVLDKIALDHSLAATHAWLLTLGMVLGLSLLLAVRDQLGQLAVSRRAWPWLVAAGVMSVVAMLLQLEAIARVWVGLLETTKRGLGSLVALVAGYLLFNERFGLQRLVAVAIMVIGVYWAAG